MPGSLFLIDLLEGVKFHEDDSGTLSSETQFFKIGKWKTHETGPFEITEEVLNKITENHEAGERSLVVDYQHMSLDDDPDKAIAAGWITKLINKGADGLWAIVEWTAAAAEKIKNKEYRFISPEFHLAYRNKETGVVQGPTLLAAALTNRPYLDGMAPVALSEGVRKVLRNRIYLEESLDRKMMKIVDAFYEEHPFLNGYGCESWVEEVYEEYLIVEACGPTGILGPHKISYSQSEDGVVSFGEMVEVEKTYIEKTTTTDDNDNKKGESEMNPETLKALGLEEGASEEEVLKAVEALNAKIEAGSVTTTEGKTKLAEVSSKLEDVSSKLEDVSSKLEETQKKNDENTLKLKEKERDQHIDKAISEGRILPKHRKVWEKKYMEDSESTLELIDTLEPCVTFDESGSGDAGVTTAKEAAKEIDKLVKAMQKEEGISYGQASKMVLRENPGLLKASRG